MSLSDSLDTIVELGLPDGTWERFCDMNGRQVFSHWEARKICRQMKLSSPEGAYRYQAVRPEPDEGGYHVQFVRPDTGEWRWTTPPDLDVAMTIGEAKALIDLLEEHGTDVRLVRWEVVS